MDGLVSWVSGAYDLFGLCARDDRARLERNAERDDDDDGGSTHTNNMQYNRVGPVV